MANIDFIYKLYLETRLITTDSRNVKRGSIFFGLRGDQYNGNLFAADALLKGAAYAIVDESEAVTGEKCILVENSLTTLQALAMKHREQVKARIIGITGSNGKTTTKELIGCVLSAKYKTVITRGNLNNHIGVPITILSIGDDTDFAVVEMGANHQGEISELCKIARPEYGIITNIGKAHLEGFGGFQGVIRAKSELYAHIRQNHGTVFVNQDNGLLIELSEGILRITYGTAADADCQGKIKTDAPFLSILAKYGLREELIPSNLVGSYNFENVLAAVCVGRHFNTPFSRIRKAIREYIPENNRSQQINTGRNTLIMDAYNANPSSMKAALENFARLPGDDKMAVLGDMMELGESGPEEHLEIIDLLKALGILQVVLVGEQFRQAASGKGMNCFEDAEAASKWIAAHPLEKHIILLKGSRKMQLEKLAGFF